MMPEIGGCRSRRRLRHPFLYTCGMGKMTTRQKLERTVAECNACLCYVPLRNEVDYAECPLLNSILQKRTNLPTKKEIDPFAEALKHREKYRDMPVCVLIPGHRFDIHGNRHGRGGGWFDRFLSNIPRAWLRIGIAPESNVFRRKLQRERWDEPVDWIISRTPSSWRVFETEARGL